MEIEFRAEARSEIEQAFAWYEQQLPGLGDAFLQAVQDAADSVLRRPQAWPVLHRDLRRRLLRRFPYSLIYRIDADRVVVVACFHASRDPKRWRSR